MSLLHVTIILALIGSTGVAQLADYWIECPRLKWVAPLEGPSPLEPAVSLVFLLEPLELDVSLFTGRNAVRQSWT